jgi:hypothetical protein
MQGNVAMKSLMRLIDVKKERKETSNVCLKTLMGMVLFSPARRFFKTAG